MSDRPHVTVFILVYNRAAYVGQAIESILGQGYADFELLLIDDGSMDESVSVMRRYDDSWGRVVENEKNCGLPHTRNRGLELARGTYIALLDSDDISLSDRLARQVEFLDAHSDCAEILLSRQHARSRV